MISCDISQRVQILARLREGKKVSQLSALRDFGCMRLAAIIYRLRGQGYDIHTETRTQGDKRYAVYTIQSAVSERKKNRTPNKGKGKRHGDGKPRSVRRRKTKNISNKKNG